MRRRTITIRRELWNIEVVAIEVVPGLGVYCEDGRCAVIHIPTGCAVIDRSTPDQERAASLCYDLQTLSPVPWDDTAYDWATDPADVVATVIPRIRTAVAEWAHFDTNQPADKPILNGTMP